MTVAVERVHAACPMCGDERGAVVHAGRAQLSDASGTFAFVRCDGCALTYLRERVSPDDLPKIETRGGYVLHAGAAAWGPFAPLVRRDERALDRRRVARVLAHRAIDRLDVVADLGCGTGSFLAAMKRRTGCAAVGFEVAATAGDGADDGFERIVAPAETWARRSVDSPRWSAVTLWHALEHDPTPVDTLRWIRERLDPRGIVVIEVPDLDGSTARWLGDAWPGFHTPRHASVFSTDTLRALARRAGYDVIAHTRRGTLKPYVPVALGLLDRLGWRFSRGSAPWIFPMWAAGYAITWPWLGRAEREGLGLQTIVLSPGGRGLA